MAVIVKGMEMPENCLRCGFNYDEMICNATGKELDWVSYTERRMPDCPLVELKFEIDGKNYAEHLISDKKCEIEDPNIEKFFEEIRKHKKHKKDPP